MSASCYQATKALELETKRTVANRANARQSTGLNTEAGNVIYSRNATVTGLTGHTVLLASDDVAEYTFHLSRHHAEYLPVTDAESELVQTIADCEWRICRIIVLEGGIYGLGEKQFADIFPEEGREVRKALIKAQTLLAYQRTLNNLSFQENRLQQQKLKAISAFEALKKNRPQTPVGVHVTVPAKAAVAALAASVSGDGFEFLNLIESDARPVAQATKRDVKFRTTH